MVKRWICALLGVALAFGLPGLSGTGLEKKAFAADVEIMEKASMPWEADERVADQWYLDAIGAKEMWTCMEKSGVRPGQGVVVAVIDSGLGLTNPDIRENLWVNEKERDGQTGVDDDNNGYIDDIYGLDLTGGGMTDSDGHGTMMAGIIGMTAGNGGGAGVAYGASIMPIRASISKNFSVQDMVEAIRYAVKNGADVINMSFGTYYHSTDQELKKAIKEASQSCVIVAAAGNEKKKINPNPNSALYDNLLPAAFPEVIGVMSAGKSNQLSAFTNWGDPYAETMNYDLAAPGEEILSTDQKGCYVSKSGTSQAAAIVSGAAAILRSLYPDRSTYPAPVLRQMMKDAVSRRTAADELHGDYTCQSLYLPDLWEVYIKNKPESGEKPESDPEEKQPADDSGIVSPDQTEQGQNPNPSDQSKQQQNPSPSDQEKDRRKTPKTIRKKGISYQLAGNNTAVVLTSDKNIQTADIQSTITEGKKKYKVTKVAKGAFKNRKKLVRLGIGKYVKTIDEEAFSGCAKLSRVTIPVNVASIGRSAFRGCSRLKTLTFRCRKVPRVGRSAFRGLAHGAVVKAPKGKRKLYNKLLKKYK